MITLAILLIALVVLTGCATLAERWAPPSVDYSACMYASTYIEDMESSVSPRSTPRPSTCL